MKHILLIILFLFSLNLSAQESPSLDRERNRAVAVYMGFLLGPALSLNYEYTLNRSALKGNSILYSRSGAGYMSILGPGHFFLASQIGILTAANKNHHLDLGIGPLITIPFESLIPITLTAAYRFQKPNGKSYFRIGGGIVEGFQLSAGLRF